MQPRDWKVRIDDILEAIDKIEQYTEGMTLEVGSNRVPNLGNGPWTSINLPRDGPQRVVG